MTFVMQEYTERIMRERALRITQMTSDEFNREGAGCRALLLPVDWAFVRSVLYFHEGSRYRLFRGLFNTHRRRCYCGETKL